VLHRFIGRLRDAVFCSGDTFKGRRQGVRQQLVHRLLVMGFDGAM
jgi:hypothetical protein